MANYLGSRVSRLVRFVAYGQGELDRLDQQDQALQASMADLRQQRRALKRQRDDLLTRLDVVKLEIGLLSNLDTNQIRAIHAQERRIIAPRGDISRALIDLLRVAKDPVPTSVLVKTLAGMFNVPMGTLQEREWMRRRVARQLRHWNERGFVFRHRGLAANDEVRWSLIDNDQADEGATGPA